MNWEEINEEQLQMVEAMGATGFTPAEIAEVLEVDQHEMEMEFVNPVRRSNSEIYRRYRKGYLQAQLELRQRIMKDAKHGSSPAQTLMKKIFDDVDHRLNQL